MKLPILIFFLVVLYWTCLSDAEEDVNPMQDIINPNDKFTYNYKDVPWEKYSSKVGSVVRKVMTELALWIVEERLFPKMKDLILNESSKDIIYPDITEKIMNILSYISDIMDKYK